MEYGIQLYSVRDMTQNDFEGAVRQVAALGYKSVEPAGFFGRTAEQINALMEETGLRISGTHSPLLDLVNKYEETLAFHKAIKNPCYIVPGYSMKNQAEIDGFVNYVNDLAPKLEKEGITLAFHNHAREFIPNADGSVAMEQIVCRTNLKLEVDTYWAFVGMKNPVSFLERVQDRLIAVHMKDGSPDGHGTPLGMGDAPVAEVYEWVKAHNIPMVVESETCTPDGMTEAKICIDYLKSLEG